MFGHLRWGRLPLAGRTSGCGFPPIRDETADGWGTGNFEGQGIVWVKQKLWRRKAAPRRKKKAGVTKAAAVE